MCGILAGYHKSRQAKWAPGLVQDMLATLSSRGPDEKAVYIEDPFFLAHSRLSIIDLDHGSQPIWNEDKTVACILNGEIYNFEKLRVELREKGHQFKTMTDTEVIVHLYEERGESVFEYLDGMFSIVIYDKKANTLLAARDRMGEKPFYYVDNPTLFLCASELKALIKHPAVSKELDKNAICAYLSLMCVPAPLSIFKNIQKLEAGRYLKVGNKGVQKKIYWKPHIKIRHSESETETIHQVREHLKNVVKNKMTADVPLGVFLSGGLDSSTIVAMAAQNSSKPIRTFCVGFGSAHDELPYAKEVAQRYGTHHTELYVKADIKSEIPKIAAYFDEPFADTSNIPTYLISQEARKHTKVVLTGDGGDELFAGYDLYLDQHISLRPKVMNWFKKNGARSYWIGHRSCFFKDDINHLFGQNVFDAENLFPDHFSPTFSENGPLASAYRFDLSYYLADDLLKKMDMASMAHGLESRAPFLDHHFVEFMMGIPFDLKIKNNQTKYLMRKAMAKDLPASILNRSKRGFGIPIESWVGGELKPLIQEALLNQPCISEIFIQNHVTEMVQRDMNALKDDWRAGLRIWILFMLELWMREYAK